MGWWTDLRVRWLIRSLQKGSTEYARQAAARALGKIGDARAVEPLIAALRDQHNHVAAEALGQIGDARAVEPLIATLRDQDRYVRGVAAKALGRIGDARAVEPFIAALQDYYGEVREAATGALVKIGYPAVEPLIAALMDQGWAVRRAATEVLGKMGDTRAVEPLITALQDQSGEVCKVAAEALWKMGDTRAVEPFIVALRDQDGAVRRAAAGALGKMGDTRAIEPFIVALRDQDVDVRRAAVGALGKMGDARAVEPLIAALRDQDVDVRQSAAEALKKIDPLWPQSEAAQRQVSNFIATLQDNDMDIRRTAVKVLGQIGDPLALEPLLKALISDKNYFFDKERAELEKQIAEENESRNDYAAAASDPNYQWAVYRTEESILRLQETLDDLPNKYAIFDHEVYAALDRFDPYAILSRFGYPPMVERLFAACRDEIPIVYRAAIKVLDSLIPINQLFLAAYPRVMCRHCKVKSKVLKDRMSRSQYTFVVCRNCGSCSDLIAGVEEIIGVISDKGEKWHQDGSTVYLRLWSESDQQACNADIDRLVIEEGPIANYERAVNAVILALKNDISRPSTWCKQIPVEIHGNPPLSVAALRMLKDAFGKVQCL
jgi:HEAT repeat protein